MARVLIEKNNFFFREFFIQKRVRIFFNIRQFTKEPVGGEKEGSKGEREKEKGRKELNVRKLKNKIKESEKQNLNQIKII